MELVGQYQKQSVMSNISIRLPWLVWMVLSALVVITVFTVGVMIAAHRTLSDPFSSYGDLFGGDARQGALARGFTCQHSPSQITNDYCVQHDPNKLFSRLSLQMSGNTVKEIVFSLHENTLTLGDLGALWGKPEISRYCETLAASWPDRQIMGLIASSQAGYIGYFSPVISVSFANGGASGWRQILMNDALHNCAA